MFGGEFTRGTVNSAVRVLYPGLCVAYAGLGLGYMTTPRETVKDSEVLRLVDLVVPLDMWGLFYMVLAIGGLAAMLSNHRTLAVVVVAIMGAAMAIWTFGTFVAVLRGAYSFGAFLMPLLVTLVCVAVGKSIVFGETTPPARER